MYIKYSVYICGHLNGKAMTQEMIYSQFATNFKIAKERRLTPQQLANVNVGFLLMLGFEKQESEAFVTLWIQECINHNLLKGKIK